MALGRVLGGVGETFLIETRGGITESKLREGAIASKLSSPALQQQGYVIIIYN